jgi:S-adenosyl-L-methionine hydrolase (adenosine-forming)
VRATRFLALAALSAAIACQRDAASTGSAPVLFLSDFGERDGAVAACKGVMLGIAPDARIVDLTHDVPAYDVVAAAEVLEQSIPFYRAGSVAVAVVDPGVGSERKAIAIRTGRGHLLVGPDNGIFTLVIDSEGLAQAVELRNTRYFRNGEPSRTFHGRDLFAPVAAHLARGVPLDSFGPAVVPVRLDIRAARVSDRSIEGVVRYVEDPYGNVVTNVPPALLDSIGAEVGDTLIVQIGSWRQSLPWRGTFSDVPRGSALALVHSRDLLSFSINQGDFASRFGVKRHDSVKVRRAPSTR